MAQSFKGTRAGVLGANGATVAAAAFPGIATVLAAGFISSAGRREASAAGRGRGSGGVMIG